MQNLTQNSDIFGFVGKNEFIPQMFKSLEKNKICSIFLTLYNSNLGNNYHIPQIFAKNCTKLNQIFENFIKFSLSQNRLNFKKTAKFCVTSNLIIHSYLQNKKIPNFANLPNLKVAKIIALLRNNFEFGVVFDAQSVFKNFVFDKITFKNKTCKISQNNEILIIEKDGFRLGILPFFKQISKDNNSNLSDDINYAMSQKSHLGLDMAYLVYPRNECFCRHIEVKNDDFAPDCALKLVPYSINNKIFTKG